MTPIHRRLHRGFTLIELMIVVSIVGMLSTVALPVYRRATLRVRTAERGTILRPRCAIGIEDAYVHGKVPPPPANLHADSQPGGRPLDRPSAISTPAPPGGPTSA